MFCGMVAYTRGYGFGVWFMVGLFFPCLGLVGVLFLPGTTTTQEALHLKTTLRKFNRIGKKRCPMCMEYIHGEAQICRFCKSPLASSDESPSEAEVPTEPQFIQDFESLPQVESVKPPPLRRVRLVDRYFPQLGLGKAILNRSIIVLLMAASLGLIVSVVFIALKRNP
jgi:hypothetical protein